MGIVRRLTILSVLAATLCGSEVAIAFDEMHLKKLKALHACEGCDLGDANLEKADRKNANLSGANLRGADLRGANFKFVQYGNATTCKTLMPWGEENTGC